MHNAALHNDEPSLEDALERIPLIEEVGEAIAHCTPPQVFGVHGDWGLGKTSFLHQVQWYLTGECPQQPESVTEYMKKKTNEPNGEVPPQKYGVYRKTIQAVWFDAWRYQNEAAPVVALLHEMRGQLSWRSRATSSVSRAVQVAALGASLSLETLTKGIGFQYSKFREASRDWESENLAAKLPSHTLREHLCEVIRQLLQEGDDEAARRLVVFIDDIDRCEPEAAYRLLEGLKIYLTLDNCVFVLGMNQKAVEEAIAQRTKAKSGDDTIMRAAAYMEKLCQNVWRLPAVRRPTQVLYGLLENTVDRPAARDFIRRGIEEPRHPCLPPNPRRLKGLANLIGRLSPRLPKETGHTMIFEAQLLVIVAYIYQFHHDLHVRWESDPSLYNIIREWCGWTPQQLEDSAFRRFEFLAPLRLPLEQNPSEETSSPTRLESTYPDPTEANVFWIQPLILHLGSAVDPEMFEHYLHGVAA